jgi:hypothetical protein
MAEPYFTNACMTCNSLHLYYTEAEEQASRVSHSSPEASFVAVLPYTILWHISSISGNRAAPACVSVIPRDTTASREARDTRGEA